MKKNMGTADRVIRLLVSAIFLYLYFTGTVTGAIGIILLVLAIMFIATSLIGYCGLYKIIGVSTCSTAKQ